MFSRCSQLNVLSNELPSLLPRGDNTKGDFSFIKPDGKDIFDLVRRVNLRVANKKCFESLAYGGAFDTFGLDRAVYFTKIDGKYTFLELVLRYGNAYQKQKSEMAFSLFGADAVGNMS